MPLRRAAVHVNVDPACARPERGVDTLRKWGLYCESSTSHMCEPSPYCVAVIQVVIPKARDRSFTASLGTAGTLEPGSRRRGDPALVRGWVDVAAADDGGYVAVGEAGGVFEDRGDAQGG